MKQIDEAVDHLIDVLLDTKEFREYQDAKAKVSQWPELKQKMDEFRYRNFEIQQMADGNRVLEETEKLEQEYEEICEDSRVHEFLQKELAFCRLMQKINIKITESIDFD